ncbi:aldo/keto reductase [Brevundimonas poindexterae]|uniref:aldo/keto reductase n=1 Tax=Brevundimonas poindexterae TaxID=74325 RepID=UPI001CFC6177|nr:aldo/keto reductase [Brevundimonas poindexterae]
MNTEIAVPPAAQLALAVVPMPTRDGMACLPQRESDLAQLLQTAADGGIRRVLTRPQGDEERSLCQAWPFPSPFQVSVTTLDAAEGADRIEARARRSLERLGLPRGEVLMVRDGRDLAGAEGRALWDRLVALKAKGLFRRIGIRSRLEDSPVLVARRLQPDLIQLPLNILDQRARRDGVLAALAEQGVAVQLASVLANGLLFAGSDEMVGASASDVVLLSRLRRRLAEARLDPMQAALAYAGDSLTGMAEGSSLVACVTSAAETRALLAAVNAPRPQLDWTLFDQGGRLAAAGDATTAFSDVSSAA